MNLKYLIKYWKKKVFHYFQKNENDADWGMEAKIYPTEDEIKNAQKSDNYNIVERVPLRIY